MNILVHYKQNYTGRCRTKANPAIVVSILDEHNATLATIPAKMVKDYLNLTTSLEGQDEKYVESRLMRHMSSAFLSVLYLHDETVLSTLTNMAKKIDIFEEAEILD